MSKLKTKEQVVADFKINILPEIVKAIGKDDFETLEHCWVVNLNELYENKEISQAQRDIWKLPKEILE